MKPAIDTEHLAPGVGLRLPHIAEVAATRPQIPWLEIHPENFLSNPHAAELLTELSCSYAISFHSVGVSVGSAAGIHQAHLKRIRHLAERIEPVFVSGHLAWSTYGGEYLNDLLPLPYTKSTLRMVADHVRQVQDFLGRPYLIENPATYVGFATSWMSEAEFLSELVHQTGCRLLCDVSNAYVSAHNMNYDPYEYIDRIPSKAVAEIHLGGYSHEGEDDGGDRLLLVDTHSEPVAAPAWDLYRHALTRFGPKPVLIERDNNIPELSALLCEAEYAGRIASETMERDCVLTR